jgi:hypothetical protein
MAAALDERFKAMVSQVPISDGRDWLHRMRREHEWVDFLEQVRQDGLRRVRTGAGEMVPPRDGIMVPTPERISTTVKADVDHRIPPLVALASAEAIFDYRPIDVVDRISPRAAMFICVEGDATTPEDHSYDLYEKAGSPKRLVVQAGTTHYAAYAQYGDIIAPLIADWFRRYLCHGDVTVHEATIETSITYLGRS